MLIPIPVGVKNVAAVQGAVWKHITCAACRQPFAFLVDVEATGEDHNILFVDQTGSAERAQEQAKQNFEQKCQKIVVPVPCPHCGVYQADMAQQLKDEASINTPQIVGGVLVALALIPLFFGIPYVWIASVALAALGVGIVIYGFVAGLRFDPNAGDPGPRKALGRKHTIWGDELAEMLASKGTETAIRDLSHKADA